MKVVDDERGRGKNGEERCNFSRKNRKRLQSSLGVENSREEFLPTKSSVVEALLKESASKREGGIV